MLSFPPAVRIWQALAPADLRKGFDALAELVRQHLRDDPLSGHVFVFRKRRSDRIKLLYWDSDGYIIVYKKLETEVPQTPYQEGITRTVAWHRSVSNSLN
jgi:transposase